MRISYQQQQSSNITSPVGQNRRDSRLFKDEQNKSVPGEIRPSERMFEYTKAEVVVLNSAKDDRLAASMYGRANRLSKSQKTRRQQKKTTKQKKGISGYDFDSLIEG